MKTKLFSLFLALVASIGPIMADPIVVTLSDVANYIDFQALSVSDSRMTSHTVTSTNPYTLANGTVLRGYANSETGAEASNSWNVKNDYNNIMPTPEWNGVDFLKAGTSFRAASGTTIELGDFITTETGKMTIYFQPNGDGQRGVSVYIRGNEIAQLTGSGVKIDGVRPAYAGEVELPAGRYNAGDVVIKLITNTSNIFGVNIEKIFDNSININGIYYTLDFDNLTAEVTHGEMAYTGDVIIPASVDFLNQTFSVTSIGENAFSNCSGLTAIIIGNNVTKIGNSAFVWCTGLNSVIIGNHVTNICEGAFAGCSTLESINIPNGVTSIGRWGFSDCYNLTTIMIPNSVTSIGFEAFSGCTSLPVENNIRYADTYLIEVVDKSLSSYTIKDGTKWISENAFNMCGNLTSITIPNSVISIGDYAFYGCYNLSSVFVGSTPPILEGRGIILSSDLTAIYVPCGTLTTYQSAEGWNNYFSLIMYEPLPTMIEMTNGYISIPQNSTICDEEVKLTAIPYPGYQFVRWEDGTTNNPRILAGSIESVKAIFTYQLSGKCGKDNLLTWTLDTTSMALNITGKGALSENYTYGDYIKFLTIGNEITSIGEEAFENFRSLKQVIIGSSVKILEKDALKNCTSIETITCYSQRPPTVNNNALSGLDYSTIVYVPADYLETYKMHDTWGLYDVRPLGAASTETSGVTVTPAQNTAEVVWPVVSGAATYELVIKDKDGNVICTLIFNANGQLTQIAFGAPARDNSSQQTQGTGFAFTITGLDSGTGYDLTITAKDTNGATLDTQAASFTTTGGSTESIDNVSANLGESTKFLRNGQVLILRSGKTYTIEGQEIIVQ